MDRWIPGLDTFKSIYKHSRVPQAFIIPSKKQWPKDLWGVKLGRQVAEWRKNKDTLSSEVVEALNEREFVWNVYEYDFQTITIPALKAYRDLFKNLLAPQSFQVPATSAWPKSTHGCQLGRAVSTLRAHKGIDCTKDKTLDAMKFIWDPIRYRFEKRMLPACQIYVQQNGDLNTMPKRYRVPKVSNIYPIECWGYCLGDKLHRWSLNGSPRQDLLNEIKALGFNPDSMAFSHQDFTKLLEGLECFHTAFGHKERVRTYKKTSTCLPIDHPTLPGLPLGQLFHESRNGMKKLAFRVIIVNNSNYFRRGIRFTNRTFIH